MDIPRLIRRGTTKNNSRVQARTPHACDRCRRKKAKCDGSKECGTCRISDSACTYTARRGREIKSNYRQMREATDEALQQLYWACRKKSDFPGNVPDESNGFVTTAAVLEGLGINVPNLDEIGAPQEFRKPAQSFEADDQVQTQSSLQANGSPVQAIVARQGGLTVETLADALPIAYEQEHNSSTITSFELAPPIQMDIHELLAMVTQPSMSAKHPSNENVESHFNAYCYGNTTEPLFSAEAILDISPDTAPLGASSSNMLCETPQLLMHSKAVTNHSSHFHSDRSVSGMMCDSFLAPWSGSLAAAHQTVSAM